MSAWQTGTFIRIISIGQGLDLPESLWPVAVRVISSNKQGCRLYGLELVIM